MTEFPDNGARFVLLRQRPAVYEVQILEAPDREHRAVLQFGDDGEHSLEWESKWPREAWLEKYLKGLIAQLRKSGTRDNIWPRRVRRWREAS